MHPFAQGGEKWSRSGTGTDDTATRTDSRPRGIFVADDKFPDVIHALQRRGWTRSRNANSPNFDLKWRNLSNINFRLLRKHQFVNHVFNSQQLSNKALLTGHLAFQHDHQRRQQQQQQQQQQQRQQLLEGPGGSEHGGGVDSVSSSPCAWSAPGGRVSNSNGPSQGQACNNASDPIPPTAAATAWKAPFQAANPEAFFPRCLDVSDDGDGVCSMLRAFAVSAAVALLRTAVNAEGESCAERHDGSGGGSIKARAVDSSTLAAATSVISRYASFLQTPLNTPPTSAAGGCLQAGPSSSGRERRVGLKRSGRDAIDAAVTVGDPEFTTILTAWEAAATADAQGAARKVGSRHAGGCTEEEGSATGKGGGVAPEPVEVAEEEPGSEPREEMDAAHGTTEDSKARSIEGREAEEETRRCSSSVAMARELLRALDEDGTDPQAALCLGPANAWVVKPAGLSCGRGVEVASSLRALVSACRKLEWKAVVQKYVERPLLVQGYKFDIRQWVLVTSCNPLVVWGFDESYTRFSSRPFTMEAPSLSDRLVHLCNHSIQKQQNRRGDESCAASASATATGVNDDSSSSKEADSGGGRETLPSGSQQNMWTAGQLRNHLRHRFQGHDVFQEVVVPRIRSVVVQTLVGVREELEMKGRAVEWLGFDLMVAEDLRVMLIEVNVSPDVSHSTPVTARLVPDATEDALSLLLDNGEADKRAAATPLPGLPNPCPSSSRSTGAEAAGEAKTVPGPDFSRTHDPGVGDRLEGEASPRVVDKLRWRVWYEGEEESRTVLRGLREEKKAWCEKRRNKRRSRQLRDSSSGVPVADDDRHMALAVVEGILDSSSRARTVAAQAAEAEPPDPPSDVALSPSGSRRTAPAEGSMEGCSSSSSSFIEGRTQDAWETVGELRGTVGELSEKLGLLTAEGGVEVTAESAVDAQHTFPEQSEDEEEEL